MIKQLMAGLMVLWILVLILPATSTDTNRVILKDGSVFYMNPTSEYEVAVNDLSKIVPVFEHNCDQNMPGLYVRGQTEFWSNGTVDVVIEDHNASVVYHEMGHVINKSWTEKQCDKYAQSRGFLIHDARY